MTDLFGMDTGAPVEAARQLELSPRGATESYLDSLANLRELAERAEHRARLRPRDPQLRYRAAQARKDYLQARDYQRGISAEEHSAALAAERRAS